LSDVAELGGPWLELLRNGQERKSPLPGAKNHLILGTGLKYLLDTSKEREIGFLPRSWTHASTYIFAYPHRTLRPSKSFHRTLSFNNVPSRPLVDTRPSFLIWFSSGSLGGIVGWNHPHSFSPSFWRSSAHHLSLVSHHTNTLSFPPKAIEPQYEVSAALIRTGPHRSVKSRITPARELPPKMRASTVTVDFASVLILLVFLCLTGVSANNGLPSNLRYEIDDAADSVPRPAYPLGAIARNKAGGHPYGYPHPPPSTSSGAGTTNTTSSFAGKLSVFPARKRSCRR